MTYWALNAVFLTIVAGLAVAAVVAKRSPRWRAIAITAGILVIMTAVFDNIMISVGLVGYSPEVISGAFIGVAPLEDFAYTIAAVVGLPCLWTLLGVHSTTNRAAPDDGAVAGTDAEGVNA